MDNKHHFRDSSDDIIFQCINCQKEWRISINCPKEILKKYWDIDVVDKNNVNEVLCSQCQKPYVSSENMEQVVNSQGPTLQRPSLSIGIWGKVRAGIGY